MHKDIENKVAIVGLGCQFPGGSDTPEKLWSILLNSRNVVGEIPSERWRIERFYNQNSTAPGKSYVRRGHFIDWEYKKFDAGFFKFAPREVEFYDPQQRLLLEVSWQAMEDAGIDPTKLAGTEVGVYVGGFTLDHMLNQLGSGARSEIGTHSAAGATLTMLSNRLSYAYDLRGPSISVDTACSSSLVAFSYAVNDIVNGVCDMALVGGVNFMLRPEYPIAMSKGQFLAADGRSKSFDADADGYGRGEGAGVVIVKSLKAALADNDRIWAVVDGVGVNQDGRTNGITVPNAEAQERLMRRVARTAGIKPEDVHYVEAHGTGTPVGDPIEASAISAVYGRGRNTPCKIGSVKSNIGHLEAAAGVAALIKACLMLKHNMVPALATLNNPNPNIPFGENGLALADKLSPLAKKEEVGRIAINSFGYGGTNAHAILSAPPVESGLMESSIKKNHSFKLLPVSARSKEALKAQAMSYATILKSGHQLEDVLYSASRRRAHLENRLAVYGDSAETIVQGLVAYVETGYSATVSEGSKPFTGNLKPVFIFTGMGPQWWGMGQMLYRSNAVFRQAMDDADKLFVKIAGFSIKREMMKSEAESRIGATEFAQPSNFMIQYALTEALKAEGVEPAAVVGHSVGEISSAWAAGMLSLEEALHVACHRSRIQKKAAGGGGMLAVGLGHEAVKAEIDVYNGKVSVAAVNSPSAVTLAGDQKCLSELARTLTARDIFARELTVEVPYHSPMMEPLKPELMQALSCLKPEAPQLPLYSTVSGERVGNERYDAEYWCRNVREPVFFEQAMRSLLDDGYTIFMEIGPHPVLRSYIQEIAQDVGVDARLCQTLNRKQDEESCFAKAVADLYAQGGDIQWSQRHSSGIYITLPHYPWQRQLLWREAESQRCDRQDDRDLALLGMRVGTANLWRCDLSDYRLSYLEDHVVDRLAIMPAAGYIEAMLQSASTIHHHPECGWRLTDVVIDKALVLEQSKALYLETSATECGRHYVVKSFDERASSTVTRHASAYIYPLKGMFGEQQDISKLCGTFEQVLSSYQAYRNFAGFSMQYAPLFQPIELVYVSGDYHEALSQLVLPGEFELHDDVYQAHPVLLDGCLQTILCLLAPDDSAYLPTRIGEMKLFRRLPSKVWCHGRVVSKNDTRIICDLTVYDTNGVPVASLEGLVCTALNQVASGTQYPEGDVRFFWNQVDAAVADAVNNKRWLLIEDGDVSMSDSLAQALCEFTGVSVDVVSWDNRPSLRQGNHNYDAVIYMSDSGFSEQTDPVALHAVKHLKNLAVDMAAVETPPRLYVVTRNAFAIKDGGQVPIPAQGALAGLNRVVFNECPMLRSTVIDLPKVVSQNCIRGLINELLANLDRDEIAIRDGEAFCADLLPTGLFAENPMIELKVADGGRFNASYRQQTELAIRETIASPLAAYEVEIQLEAINSGSTGIAAATEDAAVAGICGKVVRIGSAVKSLAVGDRVATIAPFALTSHLRVDIQATPKVVIDENAEAAYVAYAAVQHVSARRIVSMMNLESVSSAIVSDSALGYALADLLSTQGVAVKHISAVTDDWTHDSLYTLLDGEKVDLIAAPLQQWQAQFGFNMLNRGGVLVDLASTKSEVALSANAGTVIRYQMSDDLAGRHLAIATVLQEVCATLSQPVKAGAVREIAFTRLPHDASASVLNTAGVSVVFDAQQSVLAAAADHVKIDGSGTYLITGGMGGLGKETARWLAHKGAGRLVLCSRSAGKSEADQAFIGQLQAMGVQAVAHACDISDINSVREMIQSIRNSGMPLKGVFHTAGVIVDKAIHEMSDEDMDSVVIPKARGAWNLHLETLDLALDHFVLFSSISVLLGNSRQANYCAANGFLDSLAAHRKAHKLAGLSINWGAVESVGMLSHDSKIGDHLTQIGLRPVAFDVCLNGLERAISTGQVNLCISAKPEWNKWIGYEANAENSSRYKTVLAEVMANRDNSVQARLQAQLLELDYDTRLQVMSALVGEVFAASLKMPADQIDAGRPLDALGIDSLMATEIRHALDSSLGVSVSAIELVGGGTLTSLAAKCLGQLGADTIDDKAA